MASYDLNKLECRKPGAGGVVVARCPACAKDGGDKSGQHLSVRPSGEFWCVVGSESDPNHNRFIRAFLKGDGTQEDIQFIDPAPKLTVETVYPESTLAKLSPDISYWLKRGMREDVLRRLECGLAPRDEAGKLAGRTVFPLRNLEGQIVGFSGRLITNNSFAPRWKHLARIKGLTYPWNVNGPFVTKSKRAILVESIGDLLALNSHDINPVLCIFGLNLGDQIVSTLVGAAVNKVIISLNRDKDARKGQAAADRIARKLSPFISDIQIRLPNGFKDWGEAAQGGEAGAVELAAFKQETNS